MQTYFKWVFVLLFVIFSATSYSSEKEWTFLVYLNGDNNLNSYGDKDVKEMMGVGSNENVNIVVLRDFGTRQSSKILYINKGSSTAVFDYGNNTDTGDYKTLIDFFGYATKNYPAKKYAVVIWDHGAGWMDMSKGETISGISYDDSSGNHISTEQMGIALAEMKNINGGKNIDILGTDACLMAMAEVIYEVKDSVDFFVGSEETEPGDGWDYIGALSPLVNSSLSPESFSSVLVSAYIKSYPAAKVTQSAINVAKFSEVVNSVNNFVSVATGLYPTNKALFKSAVSESLYFAESSYKDFNHFLSLLSAKIQDPSLKEAAGQLKKRLKNSVVLSGNTQMPNASGVSVWIPTSTYAMSSYKRLQWSKDTSWDTFLESILK